MGDEGNAIRQLLTELEVLRLENAGVPQEASNDRRFEGRRAAERYRSVDLLDSRTGEALRRNEEQYRLVVDNVAEVICIIQDGLIKFANPRIEKVLGYTMEQGRSIPFADYIHPDDRLKAMDRYHRRMAGEDIAGALKFRVIRQDGRIRWLEGRGVQVKWGGRPAALSFFTDITRRQEAERERDRLFDLSLDMLSVSGVDGFFKQINPAWTKILGWTEGELLNRPWLYFVHPEDRPATTTVGDQLRWGKPVNFFENRYLCRDGSHRWISWHSFPLPNEGLIFSVCRDITESKRAEDALRQSEEKYRLLFDSADVLVSVYDREGLCQLMNRRVAAFFGGEPDDFIGKSFLELHGVTGEEYLLRIVNAIDSGVSGDYEDEVEFPHGKRWLLTRVHPVPDAKGVVKTAQVISHDFTERRRAEEAARESEEKFRELIERAQDGIVIVQDGRFAYLNPAYAKLTGYEPEELVGQPFNRFIHPEDRDEIEKRHRRLISGEEGPHIIQSRLVRKDGRAIDIEFNGGFINFQGKPASLTIIRDITERKQAEQERLAHVQMLEALDRINRAIHGADDLDHMMSDVLDATLAVFEADRAWLMFPCDPDASTWQVPMFRTVPEYQAGISPDAELPLTPEGSEEMRIFLESDGPVSLSPGHDSPYRAELAEAHQFKSELAMAIRPKLGLPWLFGMHQCSHARVWTADESRIFEQIGWRVADALTSLLSRRDLVESEEKFRGLVERAQDGIVIVYQHLLAYANPAMTRLIGYEVGDLIGQRFTSLIDPSCRERFEERLFGMMTDGEVASGLETKVVRWDGQAVYTECNAGRINYMGDQAALIVIRDITERKQAEKREKAQQEQLYQSAKLASLGTLVSGVAHEINNPNSYLKLNATIVSKVWSDALPILREHFRQGHKFSLAGVSFEEGELEVTDLIAGILEGSQRIQTIIEGLKEFSRQDKGRLDQAVDLNQVIESAVLLAGHLIHRSTTCFTQDLAPGLPAVRGNFQRLEQVVLNLLTNASQSLTSGDQCLHVSTLADEAKGRVLVSVRDAGQGIPTDLLPRIMDPFFTTRRDQGGIGLGLSISYGIVEEHDGRLSFESEPGRGTTATVSLPAFPDPKDNPSGRER